MTCVVVYKIRRQRTFILTAAPTVREESLAACKTRIVAQVIGHTPDPPPRRELPPIEWVIARYERAPWMFGRVVAKWPV